MSRRRTRPAALALSLAVILVPAWACGQKSGPSSRPAKPTKAPEATETFQLEAGAGEAIATFAGGCFWCSEASFEKTPGVVDAVSGFTGGKEVDPTYKDVAYGRTTHREAVRVRYDPKQITYEALLEAYWRHIDPTDGGGQFADRGGHYSPAIYVHDPAQRAAAEESKQALANSKKFSKPIAVEILEVAPFYAADAGHQNYHRTNAEHYKRYFTGSGRAAYIAEVWGKP